MSDGGDIPKISAGLGEVYEILNMDMKPYPCCRSAHCAIDALGDPEKSAGRRKGERHKTGNSWRTGRIRSKDPDQETYLVGYKQCAVSDGCLNQKTTLDAKFSTPYSAASGVVVRQGDHYRSLRRRVVAAQAVQEATP